jgi:translation initiation factor 2 subunit 2
VHIRGEVNNMGEDIYSKLLDKAEGTFSTSIRSQRRLKIPEPDIIYEGKVTIIRNFASVIEMLNRDPKIFIKFLTRELGIGISMDPPRLIINKKVDQETIRKKLEQFLQIYVECYECGSPDTEIKRVGRVDVLECKACGAQHALKMTKDINQNESTVEEGKTYSVTVNEIGQSGEGRANLRGFTLIIPGAKKGETIKVLVKRIRKGTAIAEKVKED